MLNISTNHLASSSKPIDAGGSSSQVFLLAEAFQGSTYANTQIRKQTLKPDGFVIACSIYPSSASMFWLSVCQKVNATLVFLYDY